MVDRLLGRGREREVAVPAPVAPADPRDAVWTRVLLARNPRRPHTIELLGAVADTFVELHGDRTFADDAAIVGGLARIEGRRVVVVGHQKGADTDENIRRNFGMGKPEGFRKAVRLFELADRFGLPVVTFVDTPGAYPGAEAEERGIADAIARAIMAMCRIRVPIVAVITGEGGSGGALAIAAGDVVLALENAVYSVISPEGCASILWRTGERAADAALAMRMSAQDQLALGVIDEVIPEPGDGAHTDVAETGRRVRAAIVRHLDRLALLEPDELMAARAAAVPGLRRVRRSRRGRWRPAARTPRHHGPPSACPRTRRPDAGRHAGRVGAGRPPSRRRIPRARGGVTDG